MSVRKRPALALASILLIGSAIRIVATLAPGSLMFDELATALNVTDRGWNDLIEPLGYRQIAPFGFIATEWVGVALLGSGEGGLRLFPLLASIASLLLFWRVASRFLTGAPLYAALALFAVNPALVWYARKAKQYAGDVFSVLVLLLLALRLLEGRISARRAWLAGALGGLAILLSQPSAVVAAGLFAVVLVHKWRGRERLRALVPVGLLWGLGGTMQVVTTRMLTPRGTQRFMTEAWDFAFMPAPWESLTSLFWLPTRLFHFVGFMVGLIQPDTPWEAVFLGAYAALAILGVIYLFRHDRVTATLLFTPLVVAILASALRLMPLSGRLMIYVGPTFLVACLAGLKQVEPRLPRRLRQGVMFFLVAVPAVFLPLLLPTLTRHEDADRVLREVRERWRPGDVLYAYEGAVGAMRFYGEPLGLVPWIAGRNHGPDLRAYLRDVDTLRGHSRAWFFYTHGTGCEIALIRSYLESTGMETDRIDDPHGLRGMHEAAAILYDLARPDPGSSAATHPLFERPDPRCRRGGKSTGAGIWDRLRVFLAADAG